MLKNLILDMIDANTLPELDSEEMAELSQKAEEGLVHYILEVFNY